MLNPKALVAGALSQAPSFLLARPSGIVDGVIAAYGVLLFFCSSTGYLSTIASLLVLAAVALGVGRAMDVLVPLAVARLDPSLLPTAVARGSVSATRGDGDARELSAGQPMQLSAASAAGSPRSRGVRGAAEKLD